MQEAGRGRQRGQQLPGFRAGASSWPQPQTRSDTPPSARSPTQSPPEGRGALVLLDSLRAGSGHHRVATPGTAGSRVPRRPLPAPASGSAAATAAQPRPPPAFSVAPGSRCYVSTNPTVLDRDTHGATGDPRAALALAAHSASHARAAGTGVHGPALPGGHFSALVRARLGRS